nr:phosphatase PAP2 family protein [Tomitella biformata]
MAIKYEVPALATVQYAVAQRPGVLPAARGLSHFGEHALGWMALSVLGAAIDRDRSREWFGVGVGAVAAHAASIVIKRVVRRPRPDSPAVMVGVSTPSQLSFPSSHATSSTAAAVLIGKLTGLPVAAVVVPPMLLSRLVLGVHYPSDVLVGAGVGAATAAALGRAQRRYPALRGRLFAAGNTVAQAEGTA